MVTGLTQRIPQAEFAAMVGISQARVSQMVDEGVLTRNGTAGEWLILYCERLREQAAGRGQELTAERAALAKSQRIGQEIKNATALGEYAPIGLLTDVLAAASAAVVDRFDGLMPHLSKTCPDLTETQRTQIETVLASARNEWVRSTAALAETMVDELTEETDDELLAAGGSGLVVEPDGEPE